MRRVSVACQASKGLASGVAGGEQAAQLRLAAFGDSLVCSVQQPPYPIQRVVVGAAPAGGLVVDASAQGLSESLCKRRGLRVRSDGLRAGKDHVCD